MKRRVGGWEIRKIEKKLIRVEGLRRTHIKDSVKTCRDYPKDRLRSNDRHLNHFSTTLT